VQELFKNFIDIDFRYLFNYEYGENQLL
jgi:hypothetical protein